MFNGPERRQEQVGGCRGIVETREKALRGVLWGRNPATAVRDISVNNVNNFLLTMVQFT